jgi:hypothetical protein
VMSCSLVAPDLLHQHTAHLHTAHLLHQHTAVSGNLPTWSCRHRSMAMQDAVELLCSMCDITAGSRSSPRYTALNRTMLLPAAKRKARARLALLHLARRHLRMHRTQTHPVSDADAAQEHSFAAGHAGNRVACSATGDCCVGAQAVRKHAHRQHTHTHTQELTTSEHMPSPAGGR